MSGAAASDIGWCNTDVKERKMEVILALGIGGALGVGLSVLGLRVCLSVMSRHSS